MFMIFSLIFFHDLNFVNCKVSTSISKDVEIEIDLAAEEVDNRDAKKTTAFRIGAYKPTACGKTCKRQRKLTSTVWENFTFLEFDEVDNLWFECKKCGKCIMGIPSMGLGI